MDHFAKPDDELSLAQPTNRYTVIFRAMPPMQSVTLSALAHLHWSYIWCGFNAQKSNPLEYDTLLKQNQLIDACISLSERMTNCVASIITV